MLIGQTSSKKRPFCSSFDPVAEQRGTTDGVVGESYATPVLYFCRSSTREFYERVGSRPEIPGVIKDLQPARHSFQKVAFTSWKFNGQNARIRKV